MTRTLARRGLETSATVAAEVTTVRTRRVGVRTEVSCQVRIVVAAGDRIDAGSTATVRGSGRYSESGAVALPRARRACASLVAEELAITKIAPFVAGRR